MLYNHSHQITLMPFEDRVNLSNGKSITVGRDESIGAVAVARLVPHMFLNVMVVAKGHEDIGGKNWARISRVDLTSGRTVTAFSRADVAHLKWV